MSSRFTRWGICGSTQDVYVYVYVQDGCREGVYVHMYVQDGCREGVYVYMYVQDGCREGVGGAEVGGTRGLFCFPRRGAMEGFFPENAVVVVCRPRLSFSRPHFFVFRAVSSLLPSPSRRLSLVRRLSALALSHSARTPRQPQRGREDFPY